MVAHEEALTILARSIDPRDPSCMLDAVKLMAAICLVPPDGQVYQALFVKRLCCWISWVSWLSNISNIIAVHCGPLIKLFFGFRLFFLSPRVLHSIVCSGGIMFSPCPSVFFIVRIVPTIRTITIRTAEFTPFGAHSASTVFWFPSFFSPRVLHSIVCSGGIMFSPCPSVFFYCPYRANVYWHDTDNNNMDGWMSVSTWQVPQTSTVWFYCRAVYYGCHISLEIVGRVTPKF